VRLFLEYEYFSIKHGFPGFGGKPTSVKRPLIKSGKNTPGGNQWHLQ